MKHRAWISGLAFLLLLELGACVSGMGGIAGLLPATGTSSAKGTTPSTATEQATDTGPSTVMIVNTTEYPIVLVEGTNQPGVDLLNGKAISPGNNASVTVTPGNFELRVSIKLPTGLRVVSKSGTFRAGHNFELIVNEDSSAGTYSVKSYGYLN